MPREAINSPRSPPPTPFAPSRKHRRGADKFIVGIRSFRHRPRLLPMKSVSPASLSPSYLLLLPLAPLLMPLVRLNLQQIELPDDHPKHTCACSPPAASPFLLWKQSTTRIKWGNSPCLPEPRRGHAISQKPPELTGGQLPCRDLAADEPMETLGTLSLSL
jgi:hypothetical protein